MNVVRAAEELLSEPEHKPAAYDLKQTHLRISQNTLAAYHPLLTYTYVTYVHLLDCDSNASAYRACTHRSLI